MYTQIGVIERIIMIGFVVLAGAAILMSFNRVREVGASLLASADVFRIVLGLAARRRSKPIRGRRTAQLQSTLKDVVLKSLALVVITLVIT